jgi:hypothetical protein
VKTEDSTAAEFCDAPDDSEQSEGTLSQSAEAATGASALAPSLLA